jgi:hypothetical protein
MTMIPLSNGIRNEGGKKSRGGQRCDNEQHNLGSSANGYPSQHQRKRNPNEPRDADDVFDGIHG